MRNSIILNEVFEDSMCAILFEIEYIISVPIHVNVLNTIKKKNIAETMKQYETHHILVRWSAYSPFSANKSLHEEDTCEISLFGNSSSTTINPDFNMLYTSPNSNMHDVLSSLSAPGKITFNIKKGNQVNFKPRVDVEHRSASEQSDVYLRDRSVKSQEVRTAKHHQQPIKIDRGQFTDTIRSQRNQQPQNPYNQMMPYDENLQTSQANILMNQLMNSQQMMDTSRSQQMMGLFSGNLELYPIYNPALHMPVLALSPGQIGGRTMSRAAYAKLQSAKFPAILDRYGKQADVIDGNALLKFNMQSEESDMLTCNQICIQFLAFSRTVESMRSGRTDAKPQKIFLTFQFYRFVLSTLLKLSI